MKNTMWRSIWAVAAGFLIVAVLSTLTDTVLEALGIFTPIDQPFITPWMIWLALAYRCAYTVLGGYVAAKLAPQNPMKHVWILGFIGILAATAGLIATWGKGMGPEYYPILLVVTSLPCVWLGGWLRLRPRV